MQVKDNKVSIDGHIAMAKIAFEDNAEKIKKWTEMAQDCADVTAADRCEAASKIMECGSNAAKAREFSFDDL